MNMFIQEVCLWIWWKCLHELVPIAAPDYTFEMALVRLVEIEEGGFVFDTSAVVGTYDNAFYYPVLADIFASFFPAYGLVTSFCVITCWFRVTGVGCAIYHWWLCSCRRRLLDASCYRQE